MKDTIENGMDKTELTPEADYIKCEKQGEQIVETPKRFVIKGGRTLRGEVEISGAKNAVVAILPAALLADEPCLIENVPDISDVEISIRILRELGAEVERISPHSYKIDPRGVHSSCVPYESARRMRASYYFMGALLGRFGHCRVSMPGGCPLGDRPIDQHIKAFAKLSAACKLDRGMVDITTEGGLKGNQIFFDCVTVGATMNAMLAAVKAEGQTIIENAAKEPHIVDLASFLNSMGADIMGAGTDTIKIRGVKYLRGTSYAVIPDQIEAGTYMVAAAATGGNVLVKNIIPKHLESIISVMEKIGVKIEQFDDSVRVSVDGPLVKTSIKTRPHPGFPTDMQPQMSTLLCLANGTSLIKEGVSEQRFQYVDELRRMGADIQVDGKVAVIEGTGQLTGAPVKACDLRAGAALMIAGLAASGITTIEDIHHIERGYSDMVGKLRALGACIEKTECIPDAAAGNAAITDSAVV
ncbi:MAG: UDP-N-acetylglucosamine 1-carboxyvinyltransferase [Oscillospiraceae bacterium]|nr:UDP-N-acetylglucosamine 1-carboxyvinyltransferase [Oscillospiraceae bacterium]